MQYEVTVIIDASRSATVEADSPEAAADKAMDEHGHASICHQCASELNVGDAVGAIVYDSQCETQLLDTTFQAERIAKLEAEIEQLRAAAQAADSVLEDAARWQAVGSMVEDVSGGDGHMAIVMTRNAKPEPFLQRFLADKIDVLRAARKQGGAT